MMGVLISDLDRHMHQLYWGSFYVGRFVPLDKSSILYRVFYNIHKINATHQQYKCVFF